MIGYIINNSLIAVLDPPAVSKLKWAGCILPPRHYKVIILPIGVAAAQSTQFIFVVLIHLQEQSVLPIYHHLQAKGCLNNSVVSVHIGFH